MFWHFPESFNRRIAVIQDGTKYTYAELRGLVAQAELQLPASGSLLFLFCKNDLNTLVYYLACLQAKVSVMLLDANLAREKVTRLIKAYSPFALIRDAELQLTGLLQSAIDPRLAVLLSTSGSTGSAKQVAISYDNLQSNAESICGYLPIRDTDTTITTLPCHYSYGLSVINTHLLKGASCILSEGSVMTPEFWQHLKSGDIQSFAGVPYTYEMLCKLRFQQKQFPQLRYVTQAGGRLSVELLSLFAYWMDEQDKGFYVMYGQTEATARMAWLPPEKLHIKSGSIGRAIPGGNLSLQNEKGETIHHGAGELVYEGPNVMLGYACSRDDLSQFNPERVLRTGDIATQDEDGDFYIEGRLNRYVKIFGLRISLDDVEKQLEQAGFLAKVSGTDGALFVAVINDVDCDKVKNWLGQALKLHMSVIQVLSMEAFPTNSNQKTDYRAIMAYFEAELSNCQN